MNAEKEKNQNEKNIIFEFDKENLLEYSRIDGDIDDYIYSWQCNKCVSER